MEAFASFTSPWRGEVGAPKVRREGVSGLAIKKKLKVTPPRAPSGRDPPPPGEGKTKSFSRRDARPRHAVQPHDPEKWLPVFGQDHAQETVNDSAEHHRVTPEPAVGPVFGSIVLGAYLPGFHFVQPGLQQQIKGSRTPPGACLPMVRTADKFTQSAQTICFGRGSR